MVQYKNDRSGYIRNVYWKLGPPRTGPGSTIRDVKAFLDSHNYPYKARMSAARAEVVMARCERGLLSYEHCTIAELRKFTTDRGLAATMSGNPATMPKRQLVAELEQADENKTFDGLNNLPQELKNEIFSWSMVDYPALEFGRYHEPPLLWIRSLRAETVRLFYGECTFSFAIGVNPGWQPQNCDVSVIVPTGAALQTLDEVRLRQVQHISLSIHSSLYSPGYGLSNNNRTTVWELDLSHVRGAVLLQSVPQEWLANGSIQYWTAALDLSSVTLSQVAKQADQFRGFIEMVKGRRAGAKLRRVEIDDMRRALMRDMGVQ